MEQLKSYKELVSRIEELVGKIESASLSMDELFELERLTAKLHERSIILRYKAFENKLGITNSEAIESSTEEDEEEVTPEPIPVEVEPEVIDEPEEMSFDLFEENEEVEEISFSAPEPEPEVKIEAEPAKEVENKTEPVEEKQTSSSDSGSFIDRFQADDNSISHQFSSSKLDSLIGAFGLNEKLRYINDLFDGSSELFSDSIKALDSKNTFDEASSLIDELAGKYEWDPEEETVGEFMIYVKRRYA